MKPHLKPLEFNHVKARRLFYFLGRIVFSAGNIFAILIAVIFVGGLLITFLDDKTFPEGQYLAVITALTVGYGDLAPVSWSARIVATIIGINGILLTGLVIACVVKALELTFAEELKTIERETDSSGPEN